MANGWAGDGAVQEQIDSTVADAVERARQSLPSGAGRRHCDDCGGVIPEARRRAVPGVRLCIECQGARDERTRGGSPYNRRGSKDSQLR